jgi:hypothetical protein
MDQKNGNCLKASKHLARTGQVQDKLHTDNPAIAEGYVRLLYPDKPRHPRQRYLLTVKGLALYKTVISQGRVR